MGDVLTILIVLMGVPGDDDDNTVNNSCTIKTLLVVFVFGSCQNKFSPAA